MPTKSPLSGARRADLRLGVHRRKGPALPKSVERGNLSLDTAVVRWTGSGGSGGASRSTLLPRRGGYQGREKVFA